MSVGATVRERWIQASFAVRATVIAVLVIVLLLIGAGTVAVRSTGNDSARDDAGAPFSQPLQKRMLRLSIELGASGDLPESTGRCELLWRIVAGMARRKVTADLSGESFNDEQVDAMTRPERGSLYIVVSFATHKNSEALEAVGDCHDYFVGRPLPML